MRVASSILLTAVLLFSPTVFLPPPTASACGWWGDGEMSKHWDTDAEHAHHAPDAAKLPGRSGYGLAIPDPGRATPYLNATGGRPLSRIQDLGAFGFVAVIDLGTPPETAALHRLETEAAGMRYFSIPISGEMPNRKQIEHFGRLALAAADGPILVYAPSVGLLGTMWASYRIGQLGAPLEFAISEGRSLGMTPAQAAQLKRMFGAETD